MQKKTYQLIVAVTGGSGAIASAVLTFCQPPYCTAIVAAVGIAVTAANEICALFVKAE